MFLRRAAVTTAMAGLVIGGAVTPTSACEDQAGQRVTSRRPLSLALLVGHECVDGEEKDSYSVGQVDLTVKNTTTKRRGSLTAHVTFDSVLAEDDLHAILYAFRRDSSGTLVECRTVADKAFSSDGDVDEIGVTAKLKRGRYEMQFALQDGDYRSFGAFSPSFNVTVK
jgi:hypothetical protein